MILNEHRDHTGIVRKLGLLTATDNCRKVRASRTNIATWRAANVPNEPPVYTEAQIFQIVAAAGGKIDYVTGTPIELREDQGQEGACTAASDTGAHSLLRYARGESVLKLSWPYLYDCINGGRDNGSVITDAMVVMNSGGVPLRAEYPVCKYPGHAPVLPRDTQMFTEGLQVTLGNAAEVGTAILMRWFPQFGVLVDGTYENWRDGMAYAGGAPRGDQANHSVFGAGLEIIDGVLCVLQPNSWGPKWGPRKNGICAVPCAAINRVNQADTAFAHAVTFSCVPVPVPIT